MKKTLFTTLCAGLLTVVLATPAFAAKGANKEEKKAARQTNKSVLATYDKNSNGVIDGDEVEALRKAFETDASLKALDTNKDGKLDDTEIAAVKAAGGKGAGKKKANK